MSDPQPATVQDPEQLTIDARELNDRLRYVDFNDNDRARVQQMAEAITSDVDSLVDAFFDYLARLPEADGLTKNSALRARARELKRAHLLESVTGSYDARYVEQRLALGALYARASLDPRVFLGAFHHLMRNVGLRVTRMPGAPLEAFANFMSFKKICFFDIGIIVDVLIFERERVIRAQRRTIEVLSTPVLRVREGLLVLPLVGALDTKRAMEMTASLLTAIRKHRALAIVLDVTGVPVIDSHVAAHLSNAVEAMRLMGAHTIITGVSAEVGQAMVALGADLDNVITRGDLQEGLEEAERVMAARAQ
jgi:rsbT co-antagonist protein RsbR